MKKLKRAVPADSWNSVYVFNPGWMAAQCHKKADCDCYIVPRALWERAAKALKKARKK